MSNQLSKILSGCLLIALTLQLMACEDAKVENGNCEYSIRTSENNESYATKTVASGEKLAQSLLLRQPINVSSVMIKAITSGLTALNVKFYLGSLYSNPEHGTLVGEFNFTTGLNTTSLQETWFEASTSILLSPSSTSNDAYTMIIEGTGGPLSVDYGASNGTSDLRWNFSETTSGLWLEVPGDHTQGMTVGIGGKVDCTR